MQYDFDRYIERRHTNSENVEGWRPYIFKDDPNRTFPYKDEEFIRMWVADMEFGVAPEILDGIRKRLDQEILGYTIIKEESFYQAFENWCRERYRWEFQREELTFSPGIIPAIYQIVEDVVKKGEKVLTLTPAYGYFLHACEYNGVELVTSGLFVDKNGIHIDFEDLEKKAADPAMKLLFLCNPHNPTGRIWTCEELKKIARIAEENHLWVVSDEIHCDLVRTGLRHNCMGVIMPEYDRLIVCMSASKTFNLAGMQLSEIVIRNEEERIRFQSRDKLDGSKNPLSVAAHEAAFAKGGPWLEQLRNYIDGNLQLVEDFLTEQLPKARFQMPQSTYFAWVDLSGELPEIQDLPLFFAEHAGVLLEGGNSLFVDHAEGFVRLNMAMPRKLVETGLTRMAEAVHIYQKQKGTD